LVKTTFLRIGGGRKKKDYNLLLLQEHLEKASDRHKKLSDYERKLLTLSLNEDHLGKFVFSNKLTYFIYSKSQKTILERAIVIVEKARNFALIDKNKVRYKAEEVFFIYIAQMYKYATKKEPSVTQIDGEFKGDFADFFSSILKLFNVKKENDSMARRACLLYNNKKKAKKLP